MRYLINNGCYVSHSSNRSNIFLAVRPEETGLRCGAEVSQCDLAEVYSRLPKEDQPVVRYAMNDMGSVYVHYNPNTGRNEATPNTIKTEGDTSDGHNGKRI